MIPLALAPGPLINPWIVMPVAGGLLLAVGAHLSGLGATDMPPSRRRIRVVNGWLMLFTTPLAAYAFGVASPNQTRVFVLVWLTVVGLLGIVVLLAVMDILNTQRLRRAADRALQSELARELAKDFRKESGRRNSSDPSPAPRPTDPHP